MNRWSSNRVIGWLAAVIIVAGGTPCGSARAASLSAKDVQIISKVFGFLDPPCPGGIVAVVYAAGNAVSQTDATEIAALFGTGLKAGNGIVKADAVPATSLGLGRHYVGVILAAGVAAESVTAAIRADRALCITGDVRQVQAGNCILAIRSEPQVDIVLNHNLAASAGIGFATAFRMLIHEL